MQKIHRVVLIDIIDSYQNQEDAQKKLHELKSLVATYNGIDVLDIIQHRTRPDKTTFILSANIFYFYLIAPMAFHQFNICFTLAFSVCTTSLTGKIIFTQSVNSWAHMIHSGNLYL